VVKERGPLTAGQLTDPRRRDGEWWDRRSVGRVVLEHLFAKGELAAWRTAAFERVYDLPERVLPSAVLAQPTPTVDDAQRGLVTLAGRALGVATVSDLASYYGLKRTATATRVEELVEAGELVPTRVEGWDAPAYLTRQSRLSRPRRTGATLLSPFDSLVWDRARTRRLFGFDYRIEVYVPAPARRFGYYVLPLLVGETIVGRLDVKADRKASTLRVVASYLESGADDHAVAPATAIELDSMQRWLGLDRLAVAAKGSLAPSLRRAVR
jgi:uncharacterized protein YcaQ